jgi:hypothetical protein
MISSFAIPIPIRVAYILVFLTRFLKLADLLLLMHSLKVCSFLYRLYSKELKEMRSDVSPDNGTTSPLLLQPVLYPLHPAHPMV